MTRTSWIRVWVVAVVLGLAGVRAEEVIHSINRTVFTEIPDQMPRVLEQSSPRYPAEMRRFGISGSVKVGFVVNTEGRVVDPVVLESENPAFDEEAVKAVAKWKFTPAMIRGVPVNTRVNIAIVFTIGNEPEQKQFEIKSKRDQSKLPPGERYDIPPRLRAVLLPVYPVELQKAKVTGKASVRMEIDLSGRVSRVVLNTADRPEFGFAMMAAAEGFRFEPALLKGKPVVQWVNFEQEFNAAELMDEHTEDALALEKKHPERIVSGGTLDAPLVPISRRPPLFPVALQAAGVTQGGAVIEFVVDGEGRACAPRIVSASAPEFGYAGVQAVNTWLFAPPKAAGKPVAVRVRIPFDFKTGEAPP